MRAQVLEKHATIQYVRRDRHLHGSVHTKALRPHERDSEPVLSHVTLNLLSRLFLVFPGLD